MAPQSRPRPIVAAVRAAEYAASFQGENGRSPHLPGLSAVGVVQNPDRKQNAPVVDARGIGSVAIDFRVPFADVLLDPVANENVLVICIQPQTFANGHVMPLGGKSSKIPGTVRAQVSRLKIVQDAVADQRCDMFGGRDQQIVKMHRDVAGHFARSAPFGRASGVGRPILNRFL
jgi:hypothetical protein